MTEPLGFAQRIRRRTSIFPFRNAWYFDFTPWGGGYLKADNNGPGAMSLGSGLMANIQSGQIYRDPRFD